MQRLIILCHALLLLSCQQENQNNEKNAKKINVDRPNIIFIMADDLGYADLGCYGSSYARTPHLDKLASQGIKFTQFYASSAVCTPTRAAVLSGKYPLRFNITKHFGNKEHYFTTEAVTIPKLLKQKGYYSSHIGKWHLGGFDTTDINRRRKGLAARPGPLEHGFDHYLAALRYGLKVERRLFKDAGKHLVENEQYLPTDSAHWTDININYAINVMEKCHEERKPFFINLWFDTPHTPYESAPEPYYGHYKDKIPDPENGHYNNANQKGDGDFYYSMIEHMDAGIGRLIGKLEELGIRENTLIVFTSDNGPSYRGEPGEYKAGKADLHEGGIRVPMIASMPSVVPKGIESNVLSNTIDLLPTFCAFAHTSYPQDIDGINLKKLFLEQEIPDERIMFWQLKNYKWYPQPGQKPTPFTELVVRQGNWKLLADTLAPQLLYNLATDSKEQQNLLIQYPEKADSLFQKALSFWKEERMPLLRKSHKNEN